MEVEFIKGEEVEVSSNEEGFEGSWFIATVVRHSKRKNDKYLVQYQSLVDETGSRPLREYADLCHVRPLQPKGAPRLFKPNQEVDAFVNEGWWRGVITDVLEDSKYSVYFTPTKEKMEFQQSELRLHMEWIDGKWVIPSQTQETAALTPKEASFQSPDPTGGSSLRNDMATPQTPSALGEILWDDVLSVSRSIRGRKDDQSTSKKTDIPSYTVSSTHDNMKQSNPNTDTEVIKSFKKAREEAIEVPTCIEVCHARGISSLSAADAQYVVSFHTTKGKRSKIQFRRARDPISSVKDNCVPSSTCKENGKDDLEKNSLARKRSIESSLDVVEVEHAEVTGLAKPLLQCQKKQHVLSISQKKEPLFGKEITLQGVEGINNQIENVVKRRRGRPKGSGVKQKRGSPRSPALGMSFQSKGTENESINNEVTNVECTQSPSCIEEHQAPSICLEHTDTPMIKDNGGNLVECTQLQSCVVEELQAPPLCLEKNDTPIVRDNGDNLVECTKLSSCIVEEHQAPSVCLGKIDTPMVKDNGGNLTDGTQLPSCIIEEHREPSICLEKTNTPTVKDNGGNLVESTQLLSGIVEEHRSPSLCLEKVDTPMEDNVGGIEDEATNNNQMTVQMDCPQLLIPTVEEHQILCLDLAKSDLPIKGGTEGEVANSDPKIVQMDCAQSLSSNVEDNRTLSICLEKSNPSVAGDTSMKSLEYLQPSNTFQSSISMEVGENERVFESSIDVALSTHSSPPQQDDRSLLPENASLPFIKSYNLWEGIESKEIFKLVPQLPHFRPLEKENEELREGLALGYMLSFVALWERTCKAHLDDPKSMFENKLKALTDLEELGFNVNPWRSRLEELLEIRDSYKQLSDRSKTANREVNDKCRQLDKIQESIAQLNRQLQSLLAEKQTTDFELAELRRMADAIKESIQGTRLNFDSLVATPLK